MNAHSIALLDVVYIGSHIGTTTTKSAHKWSYIKEQTPIQIVFGQKPNYMNAFVGYISSYELIRTGKDIGYNNLTTTTVRYTITGATQVMQSTNNTAWKHTSPSTIAGNIAAQNEFSWNHSYLSVSYRLPSTEHQ